MCRSRFRGNVFGDRLIHRIGGRKFLGRNEFLGDIEDRNVLFRRLLRRGSRNGGVFGKLEISRRQFILERGDSREKRFGIVGKRKIAGADHGHFGVQTRAARISLHIRLRLHPETDGIQESGQGIFLRALAEKLVLDVAHTGADRDQHIAREGDQLTPENGDIAGREMDFFNDGKRGSRISVRRRVGQLGKQSSRRRAEQAFRLFLGDAVAVTRAVFEHIQGVTHTALGKSGDQLQRAGLGGEAFSLADGTEPADDGIHCHAVKIKALTARKNGRGDLVKLRGRQNEKNVLGRLLQRFQKCVERGDREHMHLVDDIHAELHFGGRIYDAVAELADAVNAVVARGVHFHDVRRGSRIDGKTSLALSAGVAVYGRKTVRRLGDDLRAGRLTRSARTAEQIRVGKLSVFHFALQNGSDMLLSDHVVKKRGSPLSV